MLPFTVYVCCTPLPVTFRLVPLMTGAAFCRSKVYATPAIVPDVGLTDKVYGR
jgi:hypothetical protein